MCNISALKYMLFLITACFEDKCKKIIYVTCMLPQTKCMFMDKLDLNRKKTLPVKYGWPFLHDATIQKEDVPTHS